MTSHSGARRYRPELPQRPPTELSRHQKIRAAALDLFAARGYQVTTIDEIGERAGIKGPSIYKHVESKQALLVDIMVDTMDVLLALQREALTSSTDVREQLSGVVEAHVRHHTSHAREAFVGAREIQSLDELHRDEVLKKRHRYDLGLRKLIEKGVSLGVFDVASPRLASYSILDMGMGVSVWYRTSGAISEDDLVSHYVEFALRLVGATDAGVAVGPPARARRKRA